MRIYTVVDVQCGVAVGARSFTRLDDAERYFLSVGRGRNLDEDDVQLFEQEMELDGGKNPESRA